MNIAAKVRARKEQSPELYCAVRGCLWRTVTQRGARPCLKHPVAAPLIRWAVAVEYRTPATHDETRYDELLIDAADQSTAESLAADRVHARGGSIEVTSAKAERVEEDTPEENVAKARVACDSLLKVFRSAQ